MNRLFVYLVCIAMLFIPAGKHDARASTDGEEECSEEPAFEILVFIGRQIEVNRVPAEEFSLDLKYEAKYEILEVLYGDYNQSIVDFEAYDHYGYPSFAYFDTAVMYLWVSEDANYHQKYMYDPVYRTVDGEWAGCGDPYYGEPESHNHGTVQKKPLEYKAFEPTVKFMNGLKPKRVYPKEYFTHKKRHREMPFRWCLRTRIIPGQTRGSA